MQTTHRQAFRRLLVILDAASIVIAMVTAMALQSALRERIGVLKGTPPPESYLLLAYLTVPMWLSLAAVLGLYRQLERPIGPVTLFRELLQLHVFGLLGLTLLIYLVQLTINRSVVALFVVLTFGLMFMTRALLHAWIRGEHRRGHGQQQILLVTDSGSAVTHITNRLEDQSLPPRLLGCLAHEGSREDPTCWGVPIFGRPADLRRVLHENAVDLVLVSCGRNVLVDIDSLLEACDEVGVPMQCHVRVDHRGSHSIRVVDEAGVPAITFETRRRSADALMLKRLLDLVVSATGLLVLSPLLLAIALGIWVSMGRPILFRQDRTGYNGRTFSMYKFRTMERNADQRKEELHAQNEMGGPAFKMRTDPRITPFGRLLRRASLDELPQLINVLVGRMSLVGPRPLPIGEQRKISGPQRRRLSMRPGITGLWQVSGRSNLSFDEWMKLDLEYVDNWSLGLDLRLLLRTIPAVLTGRGAV